MPSSNKLAAKSYPGDQHSAYDLNIGSAMSSALCMTDVENRDHINCQLVFLPNPLRVCKMGGQIHSAAS